MECYSEGRIIRVGAKYECKMMPALKFALYTVLTTVLSQKQKMQNLMDSNLLSFVQISIIHIKRNFPV